MSLWTIKRVLLIPHWPRFTRLQFVLWHAYHVNISSADPIQFLFNPMQKSLFFSFLQLLNVCRCLCRSTVHWRRPTSSFFTQWPATPVRKATASLVPPLAAVSPTASGLVSDPPAMVRVGLFVCLFVIYNFSYFLTEVYRHQPYHLHVY